MAVHKRASNTKEALHSHSISSGCCSPDSISVVRIVDREQNSRECSLGFVAAMLMASVVDVHLSNQSKATRSRAFQDTRTSDARWSGQQYVDLPRYAEPWLRRGPDCGVCGEGFIRDCAQYGQAGSPRIRSEDEEIHSFRRRIQSNPKRKRQMREPTKVCLSDSHTQIYVNASC